MTGVETLVGRSSEAASAHIIDELIAERTIRLSRHPLWPVMRPFLTRLMYYDAARRMIDHCAPLPGWDALEHISSILALDLTIEGLDNIPTKGGFILAPSHPTGIADGIAAFDMLKRVRRDISIFANRDAERVAPQFRDVIIPVEWREGEKTRAKSRDTLQLTARAFAEQRAIVLFPAGRIAFWNEGSLTERPWQTSCVALARRYDVPIIPVNITARNSGLFYFLSRYSTELRDMTLFRELLNKRGLKFNLRIGAPVAPAQLEGDISEIATKLQHLAVNELRHDPQARFEDMPAL